MTEISDVNPLPPGWDARYDSRTGRRYFINYFTRNTSLEDPRANHKQTEYIPMQDFSRPSPMLGRAVGPPTMGAPALQYQQQKNAAAETTLEQSVAKISVMFPTVGETHIKTLLIKYLKSVFPVVEETLLLDTLCNSDNNVHRASEQLMTMGFNKRDTPPPRVTLKKSDSPQRPTTPHPPPPPRMRSVEEKQTMKERLHKKNPDIPERVVSIALDSVDYDEEKAAQILEMMQEDDKKRTETTLKIISEPKEVEVKAVPIERSNIPVQMPNNNNNNNTACQPIPPKSIQTNNNNNNNHRRCKGKKESPKINKEFSPSENKYHSQLLTKPCGANPSLANGPNVDILLPDYATWTGPNQDLVQGPDRSLLGSSVTRVKPRGPDLSLRKGPLKGLSKGSIYSRLAPSVLVNGQNDSRAK